MENSGLFKSSTSQRKPSKSGFESQMSLGTNQFLASTKKKNVLLKI